MHVEPHGPRIFGSDRDGHLLVSLDLGDTWRVDNDGLVGRVIGVTFDPTASGRVYVWTTEGIVFIRGG